MYIWRYERSSRLIRNLSNCQREAWKKKKKFRLQRDSNPWPLRYRCSALPTELWSHNCWEQVNFSGSIMPLKVIQHYSDWVCTAVMSSFIAQLVEHCTGIAEVTGSNPAEAWIFFRLLFRNCLNCVSTAKIFHNVITHNRGTNPVTITCISINWDAYLPDNAKTRFWYLDTSIKRDGCIVEKETIVVLRHIFRWDAYLLYKETIMVHCTLIRLSKGTGV